MNVEQVENLEQALTLANEFVDVMYEFSTNEKKIVSLDDMEQLYNKASELATTSEKDTIILYEISKLQTLAILISLL